MNLPLSVLGVSSHRFLRAEGVDLCPGVSSPRPGVAAPGVACPGVASQALAEGVAWPPPGVSAPKG